MKTFNGSHSDLDEYLDHEAFENIQALKKAFGNNICEYNFESDSVELLDKEDKIIKTISVNDFERVCGY